MQVKKKPKKTAKAVPEKSRKKKQPSEDQIKKQPFLKRMLFGEEKPDLSELEAGSTTILDILSPTTVDTKSRDYIIVDDVYHAYLYITGYGYTTTVGTCWLAPLVEAGEGIMLELTRVQPGFYSKDGLHEPFLLRFTGNGKGAGYLFSVAWLDAATHIATVPRMKGERIIWISESGSFGEIDLPRHHFFAARQKDGTHRFFGSNEPEKI